VHAHPVTSREYVSRNQEDLIEGRSGITSSRDRSPVYILARMALGSFQEIGCVLQYFGIHGRYIGEN